MTSENTLNLGSAQEQIGPLLLRFLVERGLDSFFDSPEYKAIAPQTLVGVDEAITSQLSDLTRLDKQDDFFDLIEELLWARMSKTSKKLIEIHESYWDLEQNFRALLLKGSTAMLEGLHTAAIHFFEQAYALEPSEIAPVVNIIQLQRLSGNEMEVERWAHTALEINKNDARIWNYLYASREVSLGSGVFASIMDESRRRKSWIGAMVAIDQHAQTEEGETHPAERAQSPESQKKAVLEEYFKNGEDSDEFMIELTGVLGAEMEYQRVCEIALAFENKPRPESRRNFPWQVFVHAAQAAYGLEKFDSALSFLAKAIRQCPNTTDRNQLKQIERQITAERDSSEREPTSAQTSQQTGCTNH